MMATGTFGKLGLLVWKNYVLQRRHWVQTMFQILVPIVLMLIVLYFRSDVERNDTGGRKFREENYPINPADLNFSIIRKVYYAPNAPEPAEIMEKIFAPKFLSVNTSDGKPKLEVKGFKSERVLLQEYYDNDYASQIDTAVIVFNEVSKRTFEYTLRLSRITPPTNVLYDKEFLVDSLDPYMPRRKTNSYTSDFLSLQYAIDVSLIHYMDKTIAIGEGNMSNMIGSHDTFLRHFPSSPKYYDQFPNYIESIIPSIIVMSFLYPVITTAKSITAEKEKGLKEFMKLVGIPNMIHWGGWFIKQFLIYFISAVVITCLFKMHIEEGKVILTYSNPFILFIFILSYLWSAILTACFISTTCSKGIASGLAAGLYWYLSSLAYDFYIRQRYHELSLSAKLAFSLVPNIALGIGWRILAIHEFRKKGVQWATIATSLRSRDGYTMLHCIFMLLFDGVLCFIAALYIEIVFPGKFGIPRPWYFPFQKSFWVMTQSPPNLLVEDSAGEGSTTSFIESAPANNEPAIVLQSLTKRFGIKVAVKNLSFTMYKNQITALLGHNGAGKTTTMAMLTGLFPPSSGTAMINGYDIRTHMKRIRESLGLCPQHNTLFDELTVQEHLWFFCKLRDCPKVNNEINRVIAAVGLQDKRTVQSKNLSGGMKRKLCVAIAIVGGAQFVLLDEPTSGMDPGARRSTWDLLTTERKGRTVVLSTHFMDEADLLSDRIAIMADGELQTVGSSLFLKKKFGAGYNLTVVKNEGCDPAQVTQLLRNHLGEDIVLGQDVGTDLSYSLPDEMSGKFADMFEELEQKKEELHVDSYGASLTTMEQVFLRVNKEAFGRKTNSTESAKETSGQTVEIYSPLQFNRDLGSRVLQQFKACLLKRILCSVRNVPLLASQFLVAPLLLLFILILMTGASLESSGPNPSIKLDLSLYGSTITPISCDPADRICQQSVSFARKSGTRVNNPADKNLTRWLAQRENKIGDDFNFEYIMALSQSGQKLTAFFNEQPLHSRPIAVNFLSNVLLRSLTSGMGKIVIHNHPLESSRDSGSHRSFHNDKYSAMAIPLVVVISLSFLVSPFVVHQIKEHTSKAKHLQFTAGAIWWVFWLTNFLVDYCVYLMVVCIQILLLLAFGEKQFVSGEAGGSLFFLHIVYGCSIIPLMYVASFMFKGPATGYSVLIFLNILLGFFSLVTVMVFEGYSLTKFERSRLIFTVTIPSFNLGWGMASIAKISRSRKYSGNRSYLSWDSPGIVLHILFMIIHGIIGVLLLFVIDNKIWRRIPRKAQRRAIAPIPNEDTEVAAEANRIHMTNLKELIAVDNIIVRDLFKQYEHVMAVLGLSFGVHQKECFGLLGVNGAGKTTTFSILTGELAPTSGDAIVYGHSVNADIRNVQRNIGYCPQFDALLGELTGREMIELVARLRGVREHQINQLVNKLGTSLLLQEHMNKPCGIYSGGNQRKLSTALAFVGNPPIVFMDEPTTGMDPGARRYVWNCINQVRDASASIVLTSHSMEECEVLCTRLAIMVSGKFVCLGSIQHLKSKFSQGFTVTAQMSRTIKPEGEGDDWEAELQPLRMFIEEAFPGCVLKDAHPQYVNYNVFNPELRWSQIFRKMEEAKETFKLEAYSVSQTTLEDVFLTLTKQ